MSQQWSGEEEETRASKLSQETAFAEMPAALKKKRIVFCKDQTQKHFAEVAPSDLFCAGHDSNDIYRMAKFSRMSG